MNEDMITTVALGRLGALGDLYNARTDKFTGFSILKGHHSETCPTAVETVDDPFSDITLSLDDCYSEKLAHLNLTADLKVSFLAGLLSLGGSGNYLKDEKKSARNIRYTLKYKITTKREKINLTSDALKAVVSSAVLNDKDATHVVTGIQWGASLHVVVEYEYEKNSDLSHTVGTLQAELQKAISCLTSLESKGHTGSTTVFETDELEAMKLSVRIYGDVLTNDEIPTTVKDALRLLQKMPSLVQQANGGKGKPVAFLLVSLSKFRSYFELPKAAPCTTVSLDESFALQFVEAFDEILRTKQNLHDLSNDLKSFEKYLLPVVLEEASVLRIKLEQGEASLKSELASTLIAVRSGCQAPAVLNALAIKYMDSEFAAAKIHSSLDDCFDTAREKMNLVRVLLGRGALICQKGQTIEHFIMDHSVKWIVLFYKRPKDDGEIELWKQNRHLFLQLLDQRHRSFTNVMYERDMTLPMDGSFNLDCVTDKFSVNIFLEITHLSRDPKKYQLDGTIFLVEFYSNGNKLFSYCTAIITNLDNSDVDLNDSIFPQYCQVEISRNLNDYKVTWDRNTKTRDERMCTKEFRSFDTAINVKIVCFGSFVKRATLNLVTIDILHSFSIGLSAVGSNTTARSKYLFVDCDVLPRQSIPETISIHRYDNGRLATRNLYRDVKGH